MTNLERIQPPNSPLSNPVTDLYHHLTMTHLSYKIKFRVSTKVYKLMTLQINVTAAKSPNIKCNKGNMWSLDKEKWRKSNREICVSLSVSFLTWVKTSLVLLQHLRQHSSYRSWGPTRSTKTSSTAVQTMRNFKLNWKNLWDHHPLTWT
jgi:hypothetical protein